MLKKVTAELPVVRRWHNTSAIGKARSGLVGSPIGEVGLQNLLLGAIVIGASLGYWETGLGYRLNGYTTAGCHRGSWRLASFPGWLAGLPLTRSSAFLATIVNPPHQTVTSERQQSPKATHRGDPAVNPAVVLPAYPAIGLLL